MPISFLLYPQVKCTTFINKDLKIPGAAVLSQTCSAGDFLLLSILTF